MEVVGVVVLAVLSASENEVMAVAAAMLMVVVVVVVVATSGLAVFVTRPGVALGDAGGQSDAGALAMQSVAALARGATSLSSARRQAALVATPQLGAASRRANAAAEQGAEGSRYSAAVWEAGAVAQVEY